MDHHLEVEAAEGSANRRNGFGKKTVLTETGRIGLEVPRDRAGSFDPQLIAKYQRRFPGFDEKIISMYARGMSDGGAPAVAILEDFEQVVAGLGAEGLQAPVVKDEQLGGTECLEAAADAAIAMGERQFIEELGHAHVEDGTVVAAGLVTERAGQPALADAGRPGDHQVVASIDPVALDETGQQPSIDSPVGAVVDVLRDGVMAQPSVTQARAEPLVLAMDGLSLQQQGQPVGMAQAGGLVVVGELVEGLGHALQAKAVQLIKRGVDKHGYSPQW